MSRIRSKNTKPEITIRRELHRAGYRFRIHYNKLPGKPDIVLPKYKTAIHVRGCFWHGHNCKNGHIPKSRIEYWSSKLRMNQIRDAENDNKLKEMGWNIIVVWECSCKSEKPLKNEMKRIYNLIESA